MTIMYPLFSSPFSLPPFPLPPRPSFPLPPVVIGATEECVLCVEDALSWLEVGNTARITGATRMNQRSSRSHAIFTLYVGMICCNEGREEEGINGGRGREGSRERGREAGTNGRLVGGVTIFFLSTFTEQKWKVLDDDSHAGLQEGEEGMTVEQCVSSKFHFVDLAGSERVRKTGNVGERFKGQLIAGRIWGLIVQFAVNLLLPPSLSLTHTHTQNLYTSTVVFYPWAMSSVR